MTAAYQSVRAGYAYDRRVTYADSKGLEEDYGFVPKIGIREGLRAFAQWYKEYYK